MQSTPKVILDTNVYISAFLTPGKARKIIEYGLRRKVIVFSSPQIEAELSRVLKEKLDYKSTELTQALTTYNEVVHKNVYPKNELDVVKADETDNRIIEAAVDSGANYIITGDKHLLNIGKYKKITILSPAAFLLDYDE